MLAQKFRDHPVFSKLSFDFVLPADDEILVDDSDTELEASQRAAKRRRIVSKGEQYLNGRPPRLLSTALIGPFDNGWVNPWAKKQGRHKDGNQRMRRHKKSEKESRVQSPPEDHDTRLEIACPLPVDLDEDSGYATKPEGHRLPFEGSRPKESEDYAHEWLRRLSTTSRHTPEVNWDEDPALDHLTTRQTPSKIFDSGAHTTAGTAEESDDSNSSKASHRSAQVASVSEDSSSSEKRAESHVSSMRVQESFRAEHIPEEAVASNDSSFLSSRATRSARRPTIAPTDFGQVLERLVLSQGDAAIVTKSHVPSKPSAANENNDQEHPSVAPRRRLQRRKPTATISQPVTEEIDEVRAPRKETTHERQNTPSNESRSRHSSLADRSYPHTYGIAQAKQLSRQAIQKLLDAEKERPKPRKEPLVYNASSSFVYRMLNTPAKTAEAPSRVPRRKAARRMSFRSSPASGPAQSVPAEPRSDEEMRQTTAPKPNSPIPDVQHAEAEESQPDAPSTVIFKGRTRPEVGQQQDDEEYSNIDLTTDGGIHVLNDVTHDAITTVVVSNAKDPTAVHRDPTEGQDQPDYDGWAEAQLLSEASQSQSQSHDAVNASLQEQSDSRPRVLLPASQFANHESRERAEQAFHDIFDSPAKEDERNSAVVEQPSTHYISGFTAINASPSKVFEQQQRSQSEDAVPSTSRQAILDAAAAIATKPAKKQKSKKRASGKISDSKKRTSAPGRKEEPEEQHVSKHVSFGDYLRRNDRSPGEPEETTVLGDTAISNIPDSRNLTRLKAQLLQDNTTTSPGPSSSAPAKSSSFTVPNTSFSSTNGEVHFSRISDSSTPQVHFSRISNSAPAARSPLARGRSASIQREDPAAEAQLHDTINEMEGFLATWDVERDLRETAKEQRRTTTI